MCVYRDGLLKREAEEQELNLQELIQVDSTEHKLERLMTSHNLKPKMTPPYAQNLFSLAQLRPSKRLHKLYYKNEGFEQNVTKCCMLSWKQEWMVHTDKCCTRSWLKWSSSRKKQSTGATKELKRAVPFTEPLQSFIHSLVREVHAVSFSLIARVSLFSRFEICRQLTDNKVQVFLGLMYRFLANSAFSSSLNF